MFYPRKLQADLEKQINSREIVVLTGMRRVGKTTLYKNLFAKIESSNKAFLDLENPLDQRVFEEKDYNNILANLKEYGVNPEEKMYVFLDEVQAKPEAVKAVKYLYDHHNIKFFLTGSSSFYLKNLFPESLAGRKFIFELFPLDFEEFLVFKNRGKKFWPTLAQKDKNKNYIAYEREKKVYDEYLEFGGFPEVALASNKEEKLMKLEDVFKSYFEKDVKTLADFGKIDAFKDLILLLSQRAGSKLDVTKISSEIGTTRATCYSYLAFLQGTYFIDLISPFSRSVDREVSGSKKVYFCDTGMANRFAKITEGNLLENAVFNSLKKFGKLNYYQKRSGAEIDFVVDEKIGVEVKTKGLESDLRRLASTSEKLGLDGFYVVTREFVDKSNFILVTDL